MTPDLFQMTINTDHGWGKRYLKILFSIRSDKRVQGVERNTAMISNSSEKKEQDVMEMLRQQYAPETNKVEVRSRFWLSHVWY